MAALAGRRGALPRPRGLRRDRRRGRQRPVHEAVPHPDGERSPGTNDRLARPEGLLRCGAERVRGHRLLRRGPLTGRVERLGETVRRWPTPRKPKAYRPPRASITRRRRPRRRLKRSSRRARSSDAEVRQALHETPAAKKAASESHNAVLKPVPGQSIRRQRHDPNPHRGAGSDPEGGRRRERIADFPYVFGGGHGSFVDHAYTARARSATRSLRAAC